jgi:hypothetical protein
MNEFFLYLDLDSPQEDPPATIRTVSVQAQRRFFSSRDLHEFRDSVHRKLHVSWFSEQLCPHPHTSIFCYAPVSRRPWIRPRNNRVHHGLFWYLWRYLPSTIPRQDHSLHGRKGRFRYCHAMLFTDLCFVPGDEPPRSAVWTIIGSRMDMHCSNAASID